MFSNATSMPSDRSERAPRHKIFEPVAIFVSDQGIRGHLLNISTTGALVHSEMAPEPGTAVTLVADGDQHKACVIWGEGRRFGIAFDRRISGTAIARLLR